MFPKNQARHEASPYSGQCFAKRVARIGVRFAWLLCATIAASAQADTFTVTNTGNSGAGSLRQAILNANAMQVTVGTLCAPHSVAFAIPGAGPHTIQPLSALPAFDIAITVDGYSQPGAVQNNLFDGDNAILKVEVDGSLAGPVDGFTMRVKSSTLCSGTGSVIRGLVINRFAGSAIAVGEGPCTVGINCQVGNIRIAGNFIGTDVTGMLARGNGAALASAALRFGKGSLHVIVGDEDATVGGPSQFLPQSRNVISGNLGDAVAMSSTSSMPIDLSASHVVRSNYIGIAANGITALPNAGRGITAGLNTAQIAIYDNLISANASDGVAILDSVSPGTAVIGNGIGIGVGAVPLGNAGNGVLASGAATGVTLGRKYLTVPFGQPSIANNGGAGVFVDDVAQLDIVNGSIGRNAGLAIDLAPVGVTPNDPADADAGPNEGLNKPIINPVVVDATTGIATISGALNAAPNSNYEIHFYTSASCGTSSSGDGEVFFQFSPGPITASVTTNAAGDAPFSRQTSFLPTNQFLTALTRRFATVPGPSALIVSEFSACRQIVSSTDLIFSNGFDG